MLDPRGRYRSDLVEMGRSGAWPVQGMGRTGRELIGEEAGLGGCGLGRWFAAGYAYHA
jgi:hypothetical protein